MVSDKPTLILGLVFGRQRHRNKLWCRSTSKTQMHGVAVLESKFEASPFRRCGNHPVRICGQRELGIFVSHFAVLIKGKPGVGKGSPICKDYFGWSCREVLAIEGAAIRIVESGRVDARASFALIG